jgi:hypothetical protein
LAFRISASGGIVFIPASFGSRPFLQSIPIHFNRGRDRLVLNPALVKSRLSLCNGACRRARPFAPSACDLLVVDEASMDDLMLTEALLKAIPD